MEKITITRTAYEQLIAVSRLHYPQEACGVLAADDGFDSVIDTVCPITNRSANPEDTFTFDPHDWVRVYTSMRRSRRMIAGFYHTHPHTPPLPSAADAAGWRQFGSKQMTYWIISLAEGPEYQPAVAAYRMIGGGISRAADDSSMLAQISIEIAERGDSAVFDPLDEPCP